MAETLDLLEIAHLKDRSPHRLSGGEKKRVALASVLMLDPEVLLMDEPTAALDPKSQSMVVDFLIGWAGGAKTVVTATHDLDIVEEIADESFVFQNGWIVAAGAPGAVLVAILRSQALGLATLSCWSQPRSAFRNASWHRSSAAARSPTSRMR